MRKTVMMIILMVGLFMASGCPAMGQPPVENGGIRPAGEKELLPFERFKFSLQGMSSWSENIEGTRQPDGGLRLEYYLSSVHWNNDIRQEEKQVIHALSGSSDFYAEIAVLLGQYQVQRWNGFAGKNPPGVLDGEMGRFNAVLTDGRQISAHGSNNFPQGFRNAWRSIRERITTAPLTSSKVETDTYAVILPDAWIGTVTVRHGIGMTVFEILHGGKKQAILLIKTKSSGYSPAKSGLEAGVLIPADKSKPQLFVTIEDGSFWQYEYKNSTEAQKADYARLRPDKKILADSIRGRNGYVFTPKE